MEYDFEGAIEKLLQEQRKTKKSLYDALGLTRQGFDNKLKNQTVSILELSIMATFFAISEADLIAILANRPISEKPTLAPGENYLREYLMALEDKFSKLLDQLSVKDHQLESKDIQITGLQRMLESVLGKFEGVTEDQLSEVMTTFNGNMNAYTLKVMLQGISMLKANPTTSNYGGKVGGTQFSYSENMVITN